MSITETALAIAERIYHDWDRALATNDVEALLRLYADDVVLESPLVCHLLGTEKGICRGKQELRKLIELVAARKPWQRQFHRAKYFTDGKTLMWEYPCITPTGEQMDFVEVMELEQGLIKYQRVYWGWYGFNILQQDKYHQI